MPLSFMVISGERSGSTWAANWLTTDTTHCIHDPLLRYTLDELDTIPGDHVGISCTALQMTPDWVNAHPAVKVIIHRPDIEIAASLQRLGGNEIEGTSGRLNQIAGHHVKFQDLFDTASACDIAAILGVPFNPRRHAELVQMNVQPQFSAVSGTERGVNQLLGLFEATKIETVKQT